jgi:hypothetical protein
MKVNKGGAMSRRFAILIAGSFALALCISISDVAIGKKRDPPWVAKDWTQWVGWDCENVLKFSPWAYYLDGGGRETDLRIDGGTSFGSRRYEFVQLRSALPIRQAFLKQAMSTKHYDKMNAQKKQIFDEEYAKDHAEDYESQIVITWASDMFWMEGSRQGALVLSDGSLVMPIKTELSGDVTLIERSMNIPHHFSFDAEYVFPRTVNGKPLYTAEDKELVFVQGGVLPYRGKPEQLGPQRPEDFRPASSDPACGFHFPISTLMYKGKLEY